jgi:SAM-dependent methyltransferase
MVYKVFLKFGIKMKCRFCFSPLKETFCNLGHTPPANSYLQEVDQKEVSFPLHAYVCEKCLLVQLGQFQRPEEIFKEYAYFSSYADTWVEHARKYVELVIHRFSLNGSCQVVEIASNDGYLLQHFKNKNIPILGIEPAKNIAKVAEEKGIPTMVQFFGLQMAKELGKKADLLIGNNVLAHVPDLNDFVAGLKAFLKEKGVITLEFPHILHLIEKNQFDTIYHEHFSYFSLLSLEKVFKKHRLEIFDVEELPTHGGSLRVYLQHPEARAIEDNVRKLLYKEKRYGLDRIETYRNFPSKVEKLRHKIREFLQEIKREGKIVVGYGAPAKGNTLLNYCKITPDLFPFTVDLSPHKQGRFLPGTRIPIHPPQKIAEVKPNYLFILPWNLREEIMAQMDFIRKWGGQFVIPIPDLEIT